MNSVEKELNEKAKRLLRNLRDAIKQDDVTEVAEILDVIKSPLLKKYPFFGINNPIGSHFMGEDYPITIAAESGTPEVFKMILEADADLQLRDHDDYDAFELIIKRSRYGDEEEERALRNQKIEMLRILLDAGYNIEAKDEFGCTAIHHAVSQRDNRIFDDVMKYNPNLNVLNNSKESPLCLAVRSNNAYKVRNLLQAGAKPDISKNFYKSELTTAAISGNLEICRMLIEAGAKVNPTGLYDRSPLYYSREGYKKNKDIEQLLIANGAEEESPFEAKIKSLAKKFEERADKRRERIQQKEQAKLDKNEALRKLKELKY